MEFSEQEDLPYTPVDPRDFTVRNNDPTDRDLEVWTQALDQPEEKRGRGCLSRLIRLGLVLLLAAVAWWAWRTLGGFG